MESMKCINGRSINFLSVVLTLGSAVVLNLKTAQGVQFSFDSDRAEVRAVNASINLTLTFRDGSGLNTITIQLQEDCKNNRVNMEYITVGDWSYTEMDTQSGNNEVPNSSVSLNYDGLDRVILITFDSLPAKYDRAVVSALLSIPGNGTIKANTTLSVKYCDNVASDQASVLVVENGTFASYEEVATFTCEKNGSHKLWIDGFYTDDDSYHISCQENATWNGTDEVECDFAPTPDILLQQDGEIVADRVVVANSTLVLNCSVAKPGHPELILEEKYYLDRRELIPKGPEFKVIPDHHESKVSCQLVNRYVREDNSSGFSHDIKLIVIFKPQIVNGSYTEEKLAELGKEFDIVFDFKANPPLNDSYTELYFEGKLKADNNSLDPSNGIYHTFKHSISLVNESDLGTYTLRALSPSERLTDRETNFTVILNSSQFDPESTTLITATTSSADGLAHEAVVGICVAAATAFVVVLVGFLSWRIRKQRSKKGETAKVETDNPLYGTTPGQAKCSSTDKKKEIKSRKEEKTNPLYQTSGISATSIEEAYGTVNQTKAGTENSGFSPDNLEVTYAAVNKPKKGKAKATEEAVYSAVDKKKKKREKDADGLHGYLKNDDA